METQDRHIFENDMEFFINLYEQKIKEIKGKDDGHNSTLQKQKGST